MAAPQTITADNGPEFTGKALHNWAQKNNVKLNPIPRQTHPKRFHRKLQQQVSQ
jgi:hypothetical protein